MRRTLLAVSAVMAAGPVLTLGYTRNIMITGYWPPTNEMVRRFSTSPVQNPQGWVGQNWEGRGYDVYSYFPEFPGGTGTNPRGEGDLEVDYQDTSADWWRIVNQVQPIAIITFSRGRAGTNWEIEARNRKMPLNQWTDDYLAPFKPTEDLPIATEPDNLIRHSSLPMQNILTAVAAGVAGMNAFIDTSDAFGGTFLSEFIGYHGNWYHGLHADPNDPAWNIAAGHIHVGINTPLDKAIAATEISLRELIGHVNTVIPEPVTLVLMGSGLLLLVGRRRR